MQRYHQLTPFPFGTQEESPIQRGHPVAPLRLGHVPDLDDAPTPKKEIACTRSFGQAVTELAPLVEAVSEFASRAAEKLRKQGSLASQLLVFAHTSPFRPGPRFNKSVVVPLRRPTADTGKLVWAAATGMRRMYQPGYKMAKAGVMLLDLVPGSVLQGELDLEEEDQRDRTKLMVTLDTLNGRYGKARCTQPAREAPARERAGG